VATAASFALEPFIVGHQVRLHPVVVLVAVFAGALLAGIAGAIMAVPLVAVAYRVMKVDNGQSLVESLPLSGPIRHPVPFASACRLFGSAIEILSHRR
jgi:predicted PurR-regulated permease PerM